ncbi:MAG: hypothetical protein KF910_04490 [Brevundimonas sp.]|uniref:hypothetical protein n=1 Tax=Brevundimonas sp. TaxID=1871086 RepID=UPI0025C05612|nr:hypothetical protein [Brevundimonas sp.]MBX3476841.1 hypothetical protein [Brevundimonas sp.]
MMTVSARTRPSPPRPVGRALAAVLFPLALILAVLVVDEPSATAVWNQAAQAAGEAWTAARTRLAPSAPDAAVARDGPILQGDFRAGDDRTRALTGQVAFVRAELRFETGGLLKTRPDRIGFGRQVSDAAGATFAALYGAGPEDQIELRQVLPGSAAGLCDGATPGWIGLWHAGDRVVLIPFRPGPPPGPAASPESPCAALTYRR